MAIACNNPLSEVVEPFLPSGFRLRVEAAFGGLQEVNNGD